MDSQRYTTHPLTHYNTPMHKFRLDILLVERGLAESRALAQRLVMAGQVRVDGQVGSSPLLAWPTAPRLVIDQGPPLSRGRRKAGCRPAAFATRQGRICADVGASTGGFTRLPAAAWRGGCTPSMSGKGILHWKLRQDPRVVVMEETNARYLEKLPEPVSPGHHRRFLHLAEGAASGGERAGCAPTRRQVVIALIKPQFEAGRGEVARGEGVIRDPAIHRQVLLDVLDFASQALGCAA